MRTASARLRLAAAGLLVAALVLAFFAAPARAQGEKLHYTYLWHMEQPVYWPTRDRAPGAGDKYELAWSSIQRKDQGAFNPTNNLRDIFSLADRVAGYQYRMRDSINTIRWTPEGGAQISFSGGLIENLNSLGANNQLGYIPFWQQWLREARGWTTHSAKPRADIVLFSHHHALLPLIDPVTVRRQVEIYKVIYPDAWGSAVPRSRGLFPSEMAFSTRLIEPLAQAGVAWTIVSAEKISRACADFPVVFGSGGINCDPPNRADQVNPAQGSAAYYRQQIDRGVSPTEASPFAFQPRRARYVNPDTGAVSTMILIPASQILGWRDGYAPIGMTDFNNLQTRNDANRPSLVLMAHDGDNAWGGGFSYYMENVSNTANQANALGYVPTTVEEYLADHPIPANEPFVHVEDGPWVNADGDFGAPQFLNWNWPPLNAAGQIDIPNGWHIDIRNWAVITAMQNRVETAEQIVTRPGGPQPGGLNLRRIVYPEDPATTPAERAWHYFGGALNSGYMYYGTAEDFEDKPALACNQAARLADPIIADASLDTTAPSIWAVQRHPWNPGSTNFGPHYGYRQSINNGDFWVWTFAYDASGLQSVTLKYRVDADGQRSLAGTENETYAGGPGVGPWQSAPMTRRVFPAANVYGESTITFNHMPLYIADQYHAQVTGLRSVLVDYYVEAVDTKGRVKRSPIHHVYVGDGSGAPPGGGGGPAVTLDPATPTAGQSVTVRYNPAGRNLAGATTVRLHWGVNGWTQVSSPDPAMTLDPATGLWSLAITPPANATVLDLVFNNGAGTWDNNGGGDWHFPVSPAANPGPQPPVINGVLDADALPVATGPSGTLYAKLYQNLLYVAAPDAGEGNDHFIFLAGPAGPGAPRAAHWAKAGQVAGWDAFLADENNNDFEGWFDHQPGTAIQAATGANGGVLEGTIDLAQEFGALPDKVHLAFAAYGNNDGGALIPSAQIPPALNGNTTLDAGEYVTVPLCQLRPEGCCRADFGLDGALNDDDLGEFITAYFEQSPGPGGYALAPCPGADAPYATAGYRADITADCSLNDDDLGEYITLYFLGCD